MEADGNILRRRIGVHVIIEETGVLVAKNDDDLIVDVPSGGVRVVETIIQFIVPVNFDFWR
eukprot:9304313-Karenia_brevis.AAC.1